MDIFQLVPKGKLWQGKYTRAIFLALEDSLNRVLIDVEKMVTDICPFTTVDLLPNWMRICNAKTREEMLGILRATGGNTPAFYETIAKKFDKDCQVLKNNPNNQFIAGVSSAGMSLGEQSIPRFCLVFHFSVAESIKEAELLLNKLKLAHYRFVFIYKTSKNEPFIAGISTAGDALNYHKESLHA
jgi:uncharacterized protein YmfQ (DUF2313 family)